MEQYFYTLKETQGFRQESLETAILFGVHQQHGIPWNEEKDSIRGIENELKKQNCFASTCEEDICTRITEHVHLVLHHQEELEKDLGWCDSEMLGEFASKSSFKARMKALEMGKDDALSIGYTNEHIRHNIMSAIHKELSWNSSCD